MTNVLTPQFIVFTAKLVKTDEWAPKSASRLRGTEGFSLHRKVAQLDFSLTCKKG